MSDQELRQELQLLNEKVDALLKQMSGSPTDKLQWKTARQTGMSREQLRYFRATQPTRVKIAKKGKQSYLYNI